MIDTETEAYLLVVCVWEGTINKEQEKKIQYVTCNQRLQKRESKGRSTRGGGGHCSCKQDGSVVTFEQISIGSEGVSHAVMWGKRKWQVPRS